jgi:hypothetical protein
VTARAVRVYRLDIIYPEGSREPGWEPAAWRAMSRSQRRKLPAVFAWPRERQFLSSSSAYERANLLGWYGADVEVQASDPVTWPNPDDREAGHWESGHTAARWVPGQDLLAEYEDDPLDRAARFLYPAPERFEQGAEPADAVPAKPLDFPAIFEELA